MERDKELELEKEREREKEREASERKTEGLPRAKLLGKEKGEKGNFSGCT